MAYALWAPCEGHPSVTHILFHSYNKQNFFSNDKDGYTALQRTSALPKGGKTVIYLYDISMQVAKKLMRAFINVRE